MHKLYKRLLLAAILSICSAVLLACGAEQTNNRSPHLPLKQLLQTPSS